MECKNSLDDRFSGNVSLLNYECAADAFFVESFPWYLAPQISFGASLEISPFCCFPASTKDLGDLIWTSSTPFADGSHRRWTITLLLDWWLRGKSYLVWRLLSATRVLLLASVLAKRGQSLPGALHFSDRVSYHFSFDWWRNDGSQSRMSNCDGIHLERNTK